MSQRTPVFLVLLLVVFSYGCKKSTENDPIPKLSKIPAITVESISSEKIKQFESIKIFIQYKDGDGDIGDENPDVHALEIVDNRGDILHTFHVPPQSPIDNISIVGTLEINLKNIIIIDRNNASEEVIFKIRLKDRAGNWSAEAESPTIVIEQ